MLEKHSAVQRGAVVGSPEKERGEIVKAFIVTTSHIEQTEEIKSEIQDFVKTRLSMHQYPKEIEFIDELPETPDGKVKRKILKSMEYERKAMKQCNPDLGRNRVFFRGSFWLQGHQPFTLQYDSQETSRLCVI